MIGRSAHLKDDHLLDCYTAQRAGASPDPRVADHLSTCGGCGARYAELAAFMDDLREQADREVDTHFPADRLASQQQQILRRLEHALRPARVISFPARDAAHAAKSPVKLAPRWLAAAAAAGLFIGVGVGGYLAPGRLGAAPAGRAGGVVPAMSVQSQAASPTSVRVNNTEVEAADDDAFLVELEVALQRPHTQELLPLDAMTPHEIDFDGGQH